MPMLTQYSQQLCDLHSATRIRRKPAQSFQRDFFIQRKYSELLFKSHWPRQKPDVLLFQL